MISIIVIQFRVNQESIDHEKRCLQQQLGDQVNIQFLSALDSTIDWFLPEKIFEGFSGIILGGSGNLDFDGGETQRDAIRQLSETVLDRLWPTFQYIFDNDIPTLGICYGHQIIGAFAGAKVKCSPEQAKICSQELKFMVNKDEYFLFSNLPDSFSAHYGHKDVLDRVPDGATLLLSGGEKCQVSALQYKNNIFTVQFHPELTYTDMIERIKSSPGYLPEGVVVEELFKDDPSSNLIVKNFVKFVLEQTKSN